MTSSARCATKSGIGAGRCTAFRRTLLSPLAQTPGGLSAATRYCCGLRPEHLRQCRDTSVST